MIMNLSIDTRIIDKENEITYFRDQIFRKVTQLIIAIHD